MTKRRALLEFGFACLKAATVVLALASLPSFAVAQQAPRSRDTPPAANDNSNVPASKEYVDTALGKALIDLDRFTGGACEAASDDTCSLNAAIMASCASSVASKIELPKATYNVSDTVDIPGSCYGVSLRGWAFRGTRLVSSAANKPILNVAGLGHHVADLSLDYTSTPAEGATAIRWTASNSFLDRVYINKAHICIEVNGSHGAFMRGFQLQDCSSVGLLTTNGVLDGYFSDFIINAGLNPSYAQNGNIRIQDWNEGLVFSNGDVLNGAVPLVIDATNDAEKQRPAFLSFYSVMFDSGVRGASINRLHESDFFGGWFSNGRPAEAGKPAYPGAVVISGDRIGFHGTRFFNSGTHGLSVKAGAKRVQVIGGSASGNSVAKAGAACGINFEPGTSDFTVTALAARSIPDAGYGTQSFGICVEKGTSNRYSIRSNLLEGNLNGPIFDGGTGTKKDVQDW